MKGRTSCSLSSGSEVPARAASSAASASATSSSYSSYTIFLSNTGMSLPRKGRNKPASTAASQNALQNSQDSKATPSSPSCSHTSARLCQASTLCCRILPSFQNGLEADSLGGVRASALRFRPMILRHTPEPRCTAWKAHLGCLQHVLYDLPHMRLQPLLLKVQHLDEASAHHLPYVVAGVVGQCKEPFDIPAHPGLDSQSPALQAGTCRA